MSVGSIIFDAKCRVFLAKRGSLALNERNRWEFPAGGVEFGETLVHALVREIAEGYGCAVEVQDLLVVFCHIIPDDL